MTYQDVKVNINGTELHLVEWPGSGDPIICLHGITCNTHWWDQIAEKLSPAYRVIAYDLPGRGDSATPDAGYGFEEHVRDLLTIIDQLGLGKVTLIGHSYGAYLACYFAAHYGHRLHKLVLVDGGMDATPLLLESTMAIINSLDQVFPSFSAYLEALRRSPYLPAGSLYAERWSYYAVTHRSDGSVISKVNKDYMLKELAVIAGRNSSVNAIHGQINTPTLVLWAPQGFGYPGVEALSRAKGEEIAGLIPGSLFVPIVDANHFTIMIKDQTIDEIVRFLSREFTWRG